MLGGCYNSKSTPGHNQPSVTANTTLAQLRSICTGSKVTFNAAMPIVVSGTVISCDKEGYISQSLYIDDGSATAKIRIGAYNSYSLYPEGTKITLKMTGLTATVVNHQLTIGLGEQLRTIDSFPLLDRYISCSAELQSVEPTPLRATELTPEMCGKLVALEQMSYAYTAYEDNYTGKYLRFHDPELNHAYIYISQYAIGFNDLMPQQPTTIRGILCYESTPMENKLIPVIYPRRRSDLK